MNKRFIALIIFIGIISGVKIADASAIPKVPNNLGLIGYWSFEDAAGETVTDFSGRGNQGTLNNMEQGDWVQGKIGRALEFDGNTESVNFGDITTFDGLGTITMSAWVKSSLTNDGRVLSKRNTSDEASFLFIVPTDGKVQVIFGITDIAKLTTGISADTWTHLTFVYDQASAASTKIYVNGVSQALSIQAVDGAIQNTASNFRISGEDTAGFQQALLGMIDEVRIYNRALADTEIAALYQQSLSTLISRQPTVNNSSLAGYWPFNQVSGSVAASGVAGGQTGILRNMEDADWVKGRYGNALIFDGHDEYVSFPATITGDTEAFTYSAWINPGTGTSYAQGFITRGQDLFGPGWSAVLTGRNGSVPVFAIVTSAPAQINAVGTTTLVAGTWYHIVGVWNKGSNIKIYVNGVEQASTDTGATTLRSSTQPERIANDNGSDPDTNFWKGIIDDPRIYNRALSSAEIRDLYNGGATTINKSIAGGTAPNHLVMWHTFDGNDLTTSTSTDRTASHNDGSIINGSGVTAGRIGQGFKFDGARDSYIAVKDSTGGNNTADVSSQSFSISTWIKVTTASSGRDQPIMSKVGATNASSSYSAVYFPTNNIIDGCGGVDEGRFGFSVYTSTSYATRYSSTTLRDPEWHHLVFRYQAGDEPNQSIYLDGVLDNGAFRNTNGCAGFALTQSSRNLPSGPETRIGGRDGVDLTNDGSIDELRFYSKALSEEEIKQLYTLGK